MIPFREKNNALIKIYTLAEKFITRSNDLMNKLQHFFQLYLDQCVILASKSTTPPVKSLYLSRKIYHAFERINFSIYQLQFDHQLLDCHNQYISSKKYNTSAKSIQEDIALERFHLSIFVASH